MVIGCIFCEGVLLSYINGVEGNWYVLIALPFAFIAGMVFYQIINERKKG